MKKFTFTFLILLLSLGSIYAQERKAVSSGQSFNMAIGTESSDTLHYMVPPGTIYTATIGGQPAGYVNGTNGYNDLGKYQRLDFAQPNVTGHSIFLYFGAKQIVGSPDTINIVIREVDTSGAPGNLLAMIPKLTSEIDTTGPMFFPLAKEMFNGLSVFVGIEWGLNVDDKFTLISNVDPNGATPSRVWEKWDNGTFHQYGSATSWTLTIDLWVGMVYSQALGGPFYIPQGTHPRGFNTLAEGIAAVNANGIAGTATFYIDADLNELGTGLVLTRGDLSESNNLIIKPNAGKTPTITITNFPASGAPNHSGLQGFTIDNCSFVTIDGSNSLDGTTRDLTIVGNDAAGLYLIGVTDNSDNITIKNINLQYLTLNANSTGIGVDGYTGVADNLLIQNCVIGSPTLAFRNGIALWGNATTTLCQAHAIDNVIYTKRRGITTFYNRKNLYRGNTIYIVTPDANQVFYSGIYLTGFQDADTSIIEGNKILKLSSNPTTTARFSGGIVVYGNSGVFNIYNNFIASNYENMATTTNEKVYGIVFGSAGWVGVANIANNTIELSATNQTGRQACIGWELNSVATLNLTNNLFINHNNNDATFGIHWPNTGGVLTSNYNNVFLGGANAKFGQHGANVYSTLTDWQTGTTLDMNTTTKAVTFASNNDLHLAGTSIGDIDLAGMPIPWITTDIDGDPRDPSMPYKGADESTPFITSTVLLEENFDYGTTSNPDLLAVTTNWTRHSGAAGPGYTNTSLGYSGYLSSNIGGSLNFTNGGSGVNDGDVHRTFDSLATTGNLYTSFLLKLNSAMATADYFFHLGPRTLGTTFRGRVYAKNSGAGFNVALSKTGNPIVDDPTVLNFGQTYLFIVKYSLNTDATNDDLVTLYVYDSGVPQTEPGTPLVTIGPIGAGVSDGLNNIGALAIRQGTNTPTGILDGIRVSTNWGDIVIPVELTSFVANSNGSNVLLNWSTATEINNSGFEVERKSSSSDWVKVGFVPGAGTTTEVKKYSFTDKNLTAGSYSYRLKQIDYDGTFAYSSIVEVDVEIPAVFDLAQNYPNPFNPSTNITYFLPVDAKVKLSVYSVTGELVKELVDDFQSAGSYTVNFDAGNLASGMYIYRIVAGDFVKSHKMMLLK